MHGEARFITRLVPPPSRVLDAGCGFGRVASKLTRLGHTAIGVDADEHLIALAREDTQTRFFVADLSTLDLRTEQEFACIVMAGNVVPYLADRTLPRVLERMAAHLAPGGYLVAGFGLGDAVPAKAAPVDLRVYDRLAEAAGLSFISRYATWDESSASCRVAPTPSRCTASSAPEDQSLPRLLVPRGPAAPLLVLTVPALGVVAGVLQRVGGGVVRLVRAHDVGVLAAVVVGLDLSGVDVEPVGHRCPPRSPWGA